MAVRCLHNWYELQAVESDGAAALNLDNVGGVFVVLVAGVFIACFITIFEMLWNISEVSQENKVIHEIRKKYFIRFKNRFVLCG